jgi:hypothetical protein
MRTGSVAAVVVVCLTAGCGSKSPAAPSPPPAPTATGLSITGTDVLRTGQSQTYTATITLSNGTTQSATPTWTADNSSVLTINSSGQASAVAQGSSTITASAQGVSATRTITVYQDYQGTWTGTYRVRVCTEQGVFIGLLCRSNFPAGTVLPIRITLTQNAASASGTLELGTIVNTISGGIFSSRRFVGAGGGSFGSGGITFNTTVGTLDVLSTATSMTGNIIFTITAVGASGNTYLEADLATVTKTGLTAQPRSTPHLATPEDVINALQTE